MPTPPNLPRPCRGPTPGGTGRRLGGRHGYPPMASPCSDTMEARSLMIWFTSNRSLCGNKMAAIRSRARPPRVLNESQGPETSPGSPRKSETLLGSEILSPDPEAKPHAEDPRAVRSLAVYRGAWKVAVQSRARLWPQHCPAGLTKGAKRLRAEGTVCTSHRPVSPADTSLLIPSQGGSLTEGPLSLLCTLGP